MASIILVGHRHNCPMHGATEVVSGAQGFTVQGRAVARVGDAMACGATILSGYPGATQEGMRVARVGDCTDHGGTLTEGDASVALG